MNKAGLREAIALVLALILWFFVRVTRSSPTSQSLAQMQMTVPIERKNSDGRMTVYDLSKDRVVVTVQGDAQAVSLLREQQINAYIDLQGDESRSLWPRVQVIVPGIVKVVSVEPQTINVKQAPQASREVPVEVEVIGKAAKGRSLGKVAITPEKVRVSGPEPLVQEITKVRTRLTLNAQSESMGFELKALSPVNAQGQPVEAPYAKIRTSPETVWATVPVVADSRSVGVAVSLANLRVDNPPGWHSSVEVEPPIVTLRVSKDQKVPEFINTRNEWFKASSRVESRRVSLQIPDGFEVVGDSEVLVRVVPVKGERKPPAPTPVPRVAPTP